MCERYISDGLEQDTAHSPKQLHSFYLQDHTKPVLEEIGDVKRYETIRRHNHISVRDRGDLAGSQYSTGHRGRRTRKTDQRLSVERKGA